MTRIAVFGNSYQAEKGTQMKHIFAVLQRLGVEVIIDGDFFHFLKEKTGVVPQYREMFYGNDFQADIALSIGGDGTFLRTAERVGVKGIPIVGINTGRLGFLADIPANDVDEALVEICKNNYKVEERTLLQLRINDYQAGYKSIGLNEVAILKRDISSMITIHVEINGCFLNSYEADGVVIATPTGSTAYSMSVGGPILEPLSTNFVISPVAPHSLTTRPLVIEDSAEISIQVKSRTGSYLVAIDGKSYKLSQEQTLSISKAPFKTRVVKRRGHTFYDTLRDKLMWGADKRG